MAGLQQLSELILVHLDYSLGSTATKRNAKDEEKKSPVDKVRKKKILFIFRLEGRKKKLISRLQQGLFLPRLAEGVGPQFQNCDPRRQQNFTA